MYLTQVGGREQKTSKEHLQELMCKRTLWMPGDFTLRRTKSSGTNRRSGIEELHAEVNARLLAQQVASKERFGRVSEWLLVF